MSVSHRRASAEITALLEAWGQGERAAVEELLPLVYGELRRIARRAIRHERPNHTLQPTALVHEAYLRLVDSGRLQWQNRSHFFAIAAKVMRRILVEHARARAAAKRGSGRPALPLVEAAGVSIERLPELIALDDSLSALARTDPLKASIVELRFFAGLSLDDTATVLDRSRSTVVRHWRLAKAWLFHELAGSREA